MTSTLIAVLFIGAFPKPTLWAEPGPVIPRGKPLTISCQGTPEAEEYSLDKEGITAPWKREKPLKPGDKVKFSIPHMTELNVGIFRCYSLSPDGWSEPSDPLELVVTGFYRKPSLSALPSAVVTSGGNNVMLLCQSQSSRDRFLLSKEGAPEAPLILRSKNQAQQYQAEFSMGPVTSVHRGTYRCYSAHSSSPYLLSLSSEPLEFLVSGEGKGPWTHRHNTMGGRRPSSLWTS
ncbi:PREDICTED: leukocyte immunoglobulin-like receptor subfamily B member 4 [Myotis davidii]|uniref:leukocyte immunoglobulin-like receptor subfamily B member 4 n=1 Tax=Myotis davidii TaxID=225400 RepID=UPI000767CA57|nr:PREDICTED: leukocyte immunoglobulin-like receptor subfamily B member 4 [Myotis davidii]